MTVSAAEPDLQHEAFERYVLPEVEVLLRVATSLTRNAADAEDLVQDTLVRAYRGIERFDGAHPRSWLLTILRNTYINSNRRRRPELVRDPDTAPQARAPETDAPDARVELGFDAAVESALAALPDPFREIIVMVDINGLTYAEAADALGVPIGTVMSRLHRGRSRIRARLASSGLAPRSRA